jgi:hypothetical protein
MGLYLERQSPLTRTLQIADRRCVAHIDGLLARPGTVHLQETDHLSLCSALPCHPDLLRDSHKWQHLPLTAQAGLRHCEYASV